MRLQDLVQNIPAQVLKINGVINYETHFVDYVAKKGQPDWAAFRSSVWGNPLALGLEWQWEVDAVTPLDASVGVDAQQEVKMDIDVGVEAKGDDSEDAPATIMDLPGSLPDVWGLQSQKILVRAEYEQAEQAALKANTSKGSYDAFLVGGQAGIGLPLSFLVHVRRS